MFPPGKSSVLDVVDVDVHAPPPSLLIASFSASVARHEIFKATHPVNFIRTFVAVVFCGTARC
ncbi:hypothetical protein AJ87_07120 [Rhizobium yanglingense]|nr:hypothetical protein AJ87_07120 [Rhizobium yanglingense]